MKQTLLVFLSSILLLSCSDKSKKQIEKQIEEQEQTITTTDSDNNANKTSNKTAIFKWETALCANTGTYDTEKYTEEELKNTYDLAIYSGAYLNTNTTPNSAAEIEKLSLSDLTAEYNEKKAFYNRKVIPSPYWEKRKAERLHELEDTYELKKIAIEAYSNPSILLNNRFSKNCTEYTKALTSNDSILLLKTWDNLVKKQKKNNGSPEKLMERYWESYYSKDRLLNAKLELMTYGWWNCANAEAFKIYDDGSMENEFTKLFTNVTSECDEP